MLTALSGDKKPEVPLAVIWPTVKVVRDSNIGILLLLLLLLLLLCIVILILMYNLSIGFAAGGSICGDLKKIAVKKVLDRYHNWEPG